VAAPPGVELVLGQRQRPALGDVELPAHQVEAVDHLGDRVLDLEAGCFISRK